MKLLQQVNVFFYYSLVFIYLEEEHNVRSCLIYDSSLKSHQQLLDLSTYLSRNANSFRYTLNINSFSSTPGGGGPNPSDNTVKNNIMNSDCLIYVHVSDGDVGDIFNDYGSNHSFVLVGMKEIDYTAITYTNPIYYITTSLASIDNGGLPSGVTYNSWEFLAVYNMFNAVKEVLNELKEIDKESFFNFLISKTYNFYDEEVSFLSEGYFQVPLLLIKYDGTNHETLFKLVTSTYLYDVITYSDGDSDDRKICNAQIGEFEDYNAYVIIFIFNYKSYSILSDINIIRILFASIQNVNSMGGINGRVIELSSIDISNPEAFKTV